MWCALAISKDGAFGTSTQRHIKSTKYNALLQCRRIASKPETCEIVDINARSDFIKHGVSKAPRKNPSPSPDSDRQLLSTGTGFVVNMKFIATADHVLRMTDRGDVCNSVSVMYRHD